MNAPGATPLHPSDASGLIPNLSTQQQLNEWERLNIYRARKWALSKRVLSRTDPLHEGYLRRLHEKMFDKTWKWAGKYRTRDGYNIGCPFHQIPERVLTLLGDVRYWVENKTFDIDESAVRFHHRLVGQIHAFPNGNGRHARMIADVLVAKHGRPPFAWGPQDVDLVNSGVIREAYMMALRALDANDNDIRPLLQFARS
jgi:Fic-DOC domain mobile mystery protein B